MREIDGKTCGVVRPHAQRSHEIETLSDVARPPQRVCSDKSKKPARPCCMPRRGRSAPLSASNTIGTIQGQA